MDIFLTKMHQFAAGGLYSPTALCEAHFIMDASAVFDFFWTVEEKHPPTAILTLGKERDFFIYNSDWIRLKEENHTHLGCFEGE